MSALTLADMMTDTTEAKASTMLYAAIRKRWAPPAWALFEEVRDRAGFSATRSADVIAMGLWESRGLELHGVEVKVSRSDWLRELKRPAKAEAIACYCDRWWLAVADASIVADGELPPTWGLVVLDKGGKLRTVREAELRTATPITRTFMAALLKRATAMQAASVHPDDLEARVAELATTRLEQRRMSEPYELRTARERNAKFDKLLEALGLNEYTLYESSLPNIAKAYALLEGGDDRYRSSLEFAVEHGELAAKRAREALAELDAMARKDVA